MKIEGHWRQSDADDKSGLPFPIARKTSWKGSRSFLKALAQKESAAEAVQYRGFSHCRICGKRNGSVEFELDGWQWPEGLRHYIQIHNVLPTEDFIEFVRGNSN